MPFVFLSIGWAVSVHAVTAFLYQGLGGRPFWNSALLAPRFIVTAFVSGPAFVILMMEGLRRITKFKIGIGPTITLLQVLRVTIVANLFMFGSEVFTALYGGGAHAASAEYLLFGVHGHNGLVPWIWTAICFNLIAVTMLMLPYARTHPWVRTVACMAAFEASTWSMRRPRSALQATLW